MPNALTDTDVVVRPTLTGFESSAVLRSADSPGELRYRLVLPAGATTRTDPDDGAIEIVEGGEPVATIAPPVARDADGWPVDVSMTLVGDELDLKVAVANADLRYPVVVDPVVSDTFNWASNCATNPRWSLWSYSASGGFSPFQGSAYLGCGNYMRDLVGTYVYSANQTAWFRYTVPGNGTEAKITSFSGTGKLDGPSPMCVGDRGGRGVDGGPGDRLHRDRDAA